MRLTCICIVLALTAGIFTDRTLAQIPERITFQPGSFAYGYRPGVVVPGVAIDAPISGVIETDGDDAVDNEGDMTKTEEEVVFIQFSSDDPTGGTPYLAWHRSPWTGRIHLIPYQPGYADAPEMFPEHQSKLNIWLSTLPSREQKRPQPKYPQQKYLGYYDPMPEIRADKPSRRQLLLGYGDPGWTASCCNSPSRARMAHCPGVDPMCFGPPAEASVTDQNIYPGLLNRRGPMHAP